MTHKKENIPDKVCTTCGRSFSYRKKWRNTWATVQYCSDGCRKNKNQEDWSQHILALLLQRGPHKSICPSEILPEDQKQNKHLMEKVRQSARKLAHLGQIEITQNSKVVSPDDFRGPIRLRLKK